MTCTLCANIKCASNLTLWIIFQTSKLFPQFWVRELKSHFSWSFCFVVHFKSFYFLLKILSWTSERPEDSISKQQCGVVWTRSCIYTRPWFEQAAPSFDRFVAHEMRYCFLLTFHIVKWSKTKYPMLFPPIAFNNVIYWEDVWQLFTFFSICLIKHSVLLTK